MTTYSALTHVQGREAAEALAEACEDLEPEPVGTGVFEIEDGSDRWEVGVYFTEAPDEIALALLAAAFGANPFAVSELPDVDWVAHVKRELTPVRAGRSFVHGSHDADKVPEFHRGLVERLHAEIPETLKKIAGGDWSDEVQKELDDAIAQFAQDFGYDLDEEGLPLTDEQAIREGRGDRDEDEDKGDDSEETEEREEEEEPATA